MKNDYKTKDAAKENSLQNVKGMACGENAENQERALSASPSPICSPSSILAEVGGVSSGDAEKMLESAESAFGYVKMVTPSDDVGLDDPPVPSL